MRLGSVEAALAKIRLNLDAGLRAAYAGKLGSGDEFAWAGSAGQGQPASAPRPREGSRREKQLGRSRQ
eukprot:419410-Heterocapsa_arctica.AAC.1